MAAQKNSFVLQDALLGINAHINRDLPIVLHKVLTEDQIWPDAHLMLHRRRDHERINDVLTDLVDLVQDELTHHYARLFKVIDFVMGRKDESFSAYFLSNCRTNVWYNTEILLDASDDEELMFHKERIDQEACTVAKQIADSRTFRLINKLAPLTRRLGWF
ncbi:hypothetical protein HM131_17545 [Halobacillus mangrovi]|uniref:Uncharacterized protein n=1 Tax=Halobacillus mangrovi TaxID=402384 RepID=A0A1W5ZZ36_9BACI|nr:hypothetical protein HM131_17545 [Halobacillus mangrovi]